MATTLEISYFNSYWMKQVNNSSSIVVFPNGYPYNTGSDALPVSGGGTLPDFPANAVDTTTSPAPLSLNWFVEESRIRGGYNNVETDLGVKAYIVEEEDQQQHRFNSMIYSGVYNSRTGINNTNQFSVAEDIVKSLDPANGSIQKLYAENTNMTVFQEAKVSSALIDKDAIYSAEGAPVQTTSNLVIGQIQPYLGEYGISKNPESFAVYGFQKYFSDKDRGVILRLSRDGITEISQYGMIDYFRDNLPQINENNVWIIEAGLSSQSNPSNNLEIFVYDVNVDALLLGMQVFQDGAFIGYIIDKSNAGIGYQVITLDRAASVTAGDAITINSIAPGKILGGYDIHNKNYTLSLQQTPQYQDNSNYSTLAFDELINGWIGFYSYKPAQMFSVKNDFYSVQYSNIWKHYSSQSNVATFYGIDGGANITFVFNQNPSVNKVFKTVNYEGDSGWQVDSFISDQTGKDLPPQQQGWQFFQDTVQTVKSYYEGSYTDQGVTYYSGFNRKENKYYANLVNNSLPQPGEVVFGSSMSGIKGRFATIKFSTDSTTDPGGAKELWSVGTEVAYLK